jgi:L-glyceraldehyde 3-phosphate reductase
MPRGGFFDLNYTPDCKRYNSMQYHRCGRSGLMLPAISLGLWYSFGDVDVYDNSKTMIKRAFDLGITHFDLANNYGTPPGSTEENFGRIIKQEFEGYRDEMVISSKAGFNMWPGPYGNLGSKKHLIASLEHSLKRMNLDYVDIFYHHRPDPETSLVETMAALDMIVRHGKALYIGLSNYNIEQTRNAVEILKELGTPYIVHQHKYSIFDRESEGKLHDLLKEEGIGSIAFSPLENGLLTNKYISGTQVDWSRLRQIYIQKNIQNIDEKIEKVRKLNLIALERGQSLSQMAIAWILREGKVTSALIGASKVSQIEENVTALDKLGFTDEELLRIDEAIK